MSLIQEFIQHYRDSSTMSSLAADFPVLDFSKFQTDFQTFSDELFAASTKWGFFVLRGTGISPDGMFDLVRVAPIHFLPATSTLTESRIVATIF